MRLSDWLRERGGIAHRADAMDAGFTVSRIRAAISTRDIDRIRARWIALPSAPEELVAAARAGGTLSCLSLARRRGWWVPPDADDRVHVHLQPNAASPGIPAIAHWSRPLAPLRPRALEAHVTDALAHAAHCLPLDQALAMWESAARAEELSLESLQQVGWRDSRSRRCAAGLSAGADSSLETIFRVRLGAWGVPLRRQVQLAGHRVDFLIGDRLIVQIDGWSFHSSSATRTRDITHDAELRMRGYTVLRFSYAQVIHRWWEVERILADAIARSLHLAG